MGIVFAHNAVIQRNLDPTACFVHLLCGAIKVHGENRSKVLAKFEPGPGTQLHSQHTNTVMPFRPTDMFPEISIQERLELDGEDIYIDQKVLINNEILSDWIPDLSKWMCNVFVSVLSTLITPIPFLDLAISVSYGCDMTRLWGAHLTRIMIGLSLANMAIMRSGT